jgi:hypothetical protein
MKKRRAKHKDLAHTPPLVYIGMYDAMLAKRRRIQ